MFNDIENGIYSFIPGNTSKRREIFLGKKDHNKYLSSISKTKKIFQNALKRLLLVSLDYLINNEKIKISRSNFIETVSIEKNIDKALIKIMLMKIFSDKELISKMIDIIHKNLDNGFLVMNFFGNEPTTKYFFQDLLREKIIRYINIIRNWWIDIYYSPYHEIGKQRLKKSYDKLFEDN